MADFIFSHPYWALLLTALLVNIPLGYIRETCQKFSLQWFFWVHASIPLIIYLRITLGTSKLLIPASIFLAIVGQVIGGRTCRKKLTSAQIEKQDKIPDLHIQKADKLEKITDAEAIVVLLNMGGPRTNSDVFDFQRRLFRDPLLIRMPLSKILQPVFTELILKLRGKRTQQRYRSIGGGSPIHHSTERQVEALANELKMRGRDIDVTFVFNYSSPFPQETMEQIKARGKKYILPLSLYPHYSAATTGSSLHYLKEAAQKIYPQSEFHEAPAYYLHDAYVQAFIDRIQETIDPQESLDDFYLIFSAHGLPLSNLVEGDPYPFQIAQTVSSVLTKLQRHHDWVISYQSAVGPLQWLKPSTESVIEALARRGKKKLIVVPISFVTDHIETLCEIDIEFREEAREQGVEDFRMSKALECHPYFIKALADSVEAALPRHTKENIALS